MADDILIDADRRKPGTDRGGADRLAHFKNDAAFADVLELTHVAGPVIFLQQIERSALKHPSRPAIPCGNALQKVLTEMRNIFKSLTQRRKRDRHDVEAIK